ncbi:MAG: aromatic compound degradation protein PaaI [Microbacteriaceae bacterium]|jgi:uncharacterized protein (TIGR00369 family)|nr:aromatic compound degradation protein PaaI [Microbacteriaceae bacterium]
MSEFANQSQPVDITRSKTVEWEDPHATASLVPTLSGLDFMLGFVNGTIPPPPIMKLMGISAVSAEVGSVTFVADPDESHYNPIGTVHGGLVCTLLDSVLGCAAQTTLAQGQAYTSLDITVSYLRPVLATSGQLTAVGRVVKPGSRAAFTEGTVHDAAGKLVATATSTLLVFPA